MGNAVRIGDAISCGDHIAVGSSEVFINSLPVATQNKKTTLGHGCWPPTTLKGPWSSTVFVNGVPVAIKDKTQIEPHRCGKKKHDGTVISGSPDVSIEA